MMNVEVLFTPAEFAALSERDLSETDCVVIDVLRATSTMVTALANGAEAIIPVGEVNEALDLRRQNGDVLLAGERDGVRIGPGLTGDVPFDFGNSPLEFVGDVVRGKTIVMTTTNGTRALRACASGHVVVATAFLNLSASSRYLLQLKPATLLIVCGGTYEEAAYEDILCAGALVERMRWDRNCRLADSALAAERIYQSEKGDLLAGLARSRNGRRLLEHPDLKDDVAFCAQCDRNDVVARLDKDGLIRCVCERVKAASLED
jgi:2-phosphosulfolactate phosphatase